MVCTPRRQRELRVVPSAQKQGAFDAKILDEAERGIRHLWVVNGRNPTQPKKSFRKLFSCMPTKPVAGEALNLHLLQ